MVSNLLPIQSVDNVDVVDSRLIAQELDVQHKNFVATIKKYKQEIEQEFGALAFYTDGLQGTSSYSEYYYLNEEQATYIMTLSRNTDKVRNCKRKLVKSFSHAKQIIVKQQENIQELTLKLALANAEKERAIAEKKLLDTRNYIVTALPEPMQQKVLGYQVVEKKVVEKVVYKENEFIRNDSTVNKTHLCKRYGIMSKSGSCDYKRLNKILATANLPSEAWLEVKDIQRNNELKVEYLNILDNLVIQDSRQLWIGE